MDIIFKSNQLIADALVLLKEILKSPTWLDVAVMERESVSFSYLSCLLRLSHTRCGVVGLSAIKAFGLVGMDGTINEKDDLATQLGFFFDRERINDAIYRHMQLTDVALLLLDAALFKASAEILLRPPYNLLVTNIEYLTEDYPTLIDFLSRDLRQMLLSRIHNAVSFNKEHASDAFLSAIDEAICHATEVANDEEPIEISQALLQQLPAPLPQQVIENYLLIHYQCDWLSAFRQKPEPYQEQEYQAKLWLLSLRQEIYQETLSKKSWGVYAQISPHFFRTGSAFGDVRLLPDRVSQILSLINLGFGDVVLCDKQFQQVKRQVIDVINTYVPTRHSSPQTQVFFDRQKEKVSQDLKIDLNDYIMREDKKTNLIEGSSAP